MSSQEESKQVLANKPSSNEDGLIMELDRRIELVRERMKDSEHLAKLLVPDSKHYTHFTEEKKSTYLIALALTGRISDSAAVAGVCYGTVRRCRSDDEEFSAAEDMAREIYRDRVRQAIEEDGLEGQLKPVKLKNADGSEQIVEWIRERNPRVLELAAKLHLPELKERVEHTGQMELHVGPLAVLPRADSQQSFEEKFGGPRLDPPIVSADQQNGDTE